MKGITGNSFNIKMQIIILTTYYSQRVRSDIPSDIDNTVHNIEIVDRDGFRVIYEHLIHSYLFLIDSHVITFETLFIVRQPIAYYTCDFSTCMIGEFLWWSVCLHAEDTQRPD